ncbi:MAG: transglutaminaseTgpA domain-containing protein [Lacisediminihabitans sp.]
MRSSGSLHPGFVLVNTAAMWVAIALASATLWPIYYSTQLIVLVVVTMVVSTAIAILGAVFRWPGFVMALASLGVFLLFGVPLAVPGSALYGVLPTGEGLLSLLSGAALGWKQLLTITLPVGSYQALLVPAFVLVLLSVVIGLSVALRARRGGLAVLAPVVFFIVGIALGPDFATWPRALALGLVATVLAWLAWRRWYARREAMRLLARVGSTDGPVSRRRVFSGVRTIMGAALVLAIAATSGAAASVLAPPSGQRQVLRSAMVQPFDPLAYPSPLSSFRSYEKAPAATSPMLTVTGLPAGARIRIATLDSYDGIVYSVGNGQANAASGSFTRVPYRFDQSAVRGTRVTMDVRIDDYAGVWVPTVGKLEHIDFSGTRAGNLRDSFYYNDNSGTAAVVRPLTTGDSYTLTSVIPAQPSPSQLGTVQPGTATVPQLGVIPDALLTTLDEYVNGISGAGARLAAAVAGLKENGYISHGVSPDEPFSRSGHAADRITQLLTDQRMIGDQEQYAVTAALMARQLGFPARVVFGFVPNIAAAGPTRVQGSDISAWIEVDTAQFGWVSVDPTPAVRKIPDEQPQDPTQIARPQSPVQPPPQQPQADNVQTPPDSTQENPAVENALLAILFAALVIAGWSILAIAIVLAPFLAIIVAKHRRRILRRRAPLAVERVSGGWREFEDSVLDHGYPIPPAPTRTEVAAVVGGMQPLVLASVADRAVFSSGEPDNEEVLQVWRSVDELRISLGAELSRWQRIKVLISVRSLGGYSVKSLFKR